MKHGCLRQDEFSFRMVGDVPRLDLLYPQRPRSAVSYKSFVFICLIVDTTLVRLYSESIPEDPMKGYSLLATIGLGLSACVVYLAFVRARRTCAHVDLLHVFAEVR